MSRRFKKHYPRGHNLVLYINNIFFGTIDENEYLTGPAGRIRQGAAQDSINVALAVGHLDATFIHKHDLTARKIKEQLSEIKKEVNSSPTKYFALYLVIASHGNENVIYGTDDEPVFVYDDIIRPFHNANCMGLRGKPKLFLFNACRGERGKNAMVFDAPTSSTSHVNYQTDALVGKLGKFEFVQDVGDFALMYSTAPESISLRVADAGCPLIQTLFSAIAELADQGKLANEEFTDIFKNVQRQIHQEYGTQPGIINHLVKDVFLPVKGNTCYALQVHFH